MSGLLRKNGDNAGHKYEWQQPKKPCHEFPRFESFGFAEFAPLKGGKKMQ